MLDGESTPHGLLATAARRVRTACTVALTLLALLGTWWGIYLYATGDAPDGATATWTGAFTTWVHGRWKVEVPVPLAISVMWFGPLLVAVAAVLCRHRLRRDPARVPAALTLLSACAIVCFISATWVSIEWGWEHTDADGNRSSFWANHSPGPCCGVSNLLLAGWCGWAALRYGPTFREYPDGK